MDTVCQKQLNLEVFLVYKSQAICWWQHYLRCWEWLLREHDERCGLAEGAAKSLHDPRHGNILIHHPKPFWLFFWFPVALVVASELPGHPLHGEFETSTDWGTVSAAVELN